MLHEKRIENLKSGKMNLTEESMGESNQNGYGDEDLEDEENGQ